MTRHEHVIPSLGEPRHEWCSRCHKTTLVVVEIYAITSEAAHTIGYYAICEDCGWAPYADNTESSR